MWLSPVNMEFIISREFHVSLHMGAQLGFNFVCFSFLFSCVLRWAWSEILRWFYWTSHRQEWTLNLNSACGKNLFIIFIKSYICPPPPTSLRSLCRRAIRAAFKNQQRGAILTTHYMEEAEAVCDRVAIMVSGQLRLVRPDSCLFLQLWAVRNWRPLFSHQMYRHHPAFERKIRSRLQPGGETARGADGPAAGGAVAQGDPPDLSSRVASREVSASRVCAGVTKHLLQFVHKFQNKFWFRMKSTQIYIFFLFGWWGQWE